MPAKTVEFLRIDLSDRTSKKTISHTKLYSILDAIFTTHCKDHHKYKTLDLTPSIVPNDIKPKIVLDVFEMRPEALFARVCKKKSNNGILRRNYTSLKADEVFNPTEATKLGIEVFTYLYIDFKSGIISIVNAKDAPGPSILNEIFDSYDNTYNLDFVNIPNKEGINVLYESKEPKITGLEFEVPVPDARFLQQVLGLNEEEIAIITRNDYYRTIISLKPEPHKALEDDKSNVRKIIDILKRKKTTYPRVIIKGRSADFNTKEFDLHARFYTYPIDIKLYKMVAGKKKEYGLEDITEQFKKGLVDAFNGNKDLLLALSRREEDERNGENI
ncbi:MAG: hypothetical protein ACK5JH_15280 [Anaerocolumna sp.]